MVNHEIEYIKKTYNLPFIKIGMMVIANGNKGIITGTHNASLKIVCENPNQSGVYHPTWQMTYLDENRKVLAEFGD